MAEPTSPARTSHVSSVLRLVGALLGWCLRGVGRAVYPLTLAIMMLDRIVTAAHDRSMRRWVARGSGRS